MSSPANSQENHGFYSRQGLARLGIQVCIVIITRLMLGVDQLDPPGLIHDDLRLLPPWRGSSLFSGKFSNSFRLTVQTLPNLHVRVDFFHPAVSGCVSTLRPADLYRWSIFIFCVATARKAYSVGSIRSRTGQRRFELYPQTRLHPQRGRRRLSVRDRQAPWWSGDLQHGVDHARRRWRIA
jgi:hypothetical protein